MTTATTHSTMASANHTGQSAPDAVQYPGLTGSECDPTDMACPEFGSDLPQPADTLLKWAPCAQLQRWAAEYGNEECWSGTGACSAYPGLRLNHFLELLKLLEGNAWSKTYEMHAPLGKARTLCVWLRHLGAPIPPLTSITTQDAGNFLRKCERAVKHLHGRTDLEHTPAYSTIAELRAKPWRQMAYVDSPGGAATPAAIPPAATPSAAASPPAASPPAETPPDETPPDETPQVATAATTCTSAATTPPAAPSPLSNPLFDPERRRLQKDLLSERKAHECTFKLLH